MPSPAERAAVPGPRACDHGAVNGRLVLLVAASLTLIPGSARAGEGQVSGAAPPADNSSYVPDDVDAVRRDLARATAALKSRDPVEAVRALQRVAVGPVDAVVPAGEPGVFEGVERAAHLRVVAAGKACLDAYEREFGAAALDALERALRALDERRIAEVVDAYRPSTAGRRAALLLADFAIERADGDAAQEWLEGIEDLEECAAEDLAADVASWRDARFARLALVLARDADAAARIAVALRRRPAEPIGRSDRRRRPPARDWATTGGDATRARVAPALGESVRFASSESLLPVNPPPSPFGSDENPPPRPSLWIPTRAVLSGGKIHVSDGRSLFRFDASSGLFLGALAFEPGRRADVSRPPAVGRPSRARYGWMEGHGLTVDGDRVYATRGADRERAIDPFGEAARTAESPGDRIAAYDVVAGALVRRWEAGEGVATRGLAAGMRLHGTPLLYRGAIHVTGLRATPATADRLEAWHVALDPDSGEVVTTTFLGAGGPIRRRRDDEAIPTSCAAAHGRVVVVTSIGIAAAVDARSGRTLWSWRYDRGRPDGDDIGHRLDEGIETGERKSSFVNEPPLLVDGRCFFAPTDARHLFAVTDRPRGRARTIRLWRRHRVDDFRNLAVEQIVGIVGEADLDAPTMVVAGQGYEGGGAPHTAVVGLDPATGAMRWERALPFATEAEPFGRALVTAGEVYVPAPGGIARYRVLDGTELPSLDRAALEADGQSPFDPEGHELMPIGNLVPIPGEGLVAVSTSSVSIWRAR